MKKQINQDSEFNALLDQAKDKADENNQDSRLQIESLRRTKEMNVKNYIASQEALEKQEAGKVSEATRLANQELLLPSIEKLLAEFLAYQAKESLTPAEHEKLVSLILTVAKHKGEITLLCYSKDRGVISGKWERIRTIIVLLKKKWREKWEKTFDKATISAISMGGDDLPGKVRLQQDGLWPMPPMTSA